MTKQACYKSINKKCSNYYVKNGVKYCLTYATNEGTKVESIDFKCVGCNHG